MNNRIESYLPGEGLIVFEVLTQSRQEKSEFTEFQEILAVFVLSLGLVFGEMEGTVYSLEKKVLLYCSTGLGLLRFFSEDNDLDN